jgi:guanine deaminase
MLQKNKKYMIEAIRLSLENIEMGGGPFGAVIVRDGLIISTGVNLVTIMNDPTAHAEIVAIRKAAEILRNFDLSDCEIYSSCEPCPMCLSAIYWAKIKTVFYGNSKKDASKINFDDAFIYNEINKSNEFRKLHMYQLMQHEANVAFIKWKNKTDKKEY